MNKSLKAQWSNISRPILLAIFSVNERNAKQRNEYLPHLSLETHVGGNVGDAIKGRGKDNEIQFIFLYKILQINNKDEWILNKIILFQAAFYSILWKRRMSCNHRHRGVGFVLLHKCFPWAPLPVLSLVIAPHPASNFSIKLFSNYLFLNLPQSCFHWAPSNLPTWPARSSIWYQHDLSIACYSTRFSKSLSINILFS